MIRRLGNQILDHVERQVANKAIEVLAPHVDNIVEGVLDAVVNTAPAVKSTGGATQSILAKIQTDFHDFHSSDAQLAIQTFILEYLDVKYQNKSQFEQSNVADDLMMRIGPKATSRLSDIKINQIAISDYKKSLHSATITYRVSIGFNLGGNRREKLYEVLYTLRLRDEYGSKQFLRCEVCDAPLTETSGECKYCGTKHIRDTVENWLITNVIEK